MKWKLKTVLVLSAHTDDMELGAGATVRMLAESGVEVISVVFSDCKRSVDNSRYPESILREECIKAAKHLGIKEPTIHEYPVREFPRFRQDILEDIYKLRKEYEIDAVFTHFEGDMHQDHKTVAEETSRAFMKTQKTILAYEIPGNCIEFSPNAFVEIDEDALQKKIEMLHQYESQVVRRGYFEVEALRAQVRFYGNQIGTKYAEAFSIKRQVVDNFSKE